MTSRAIHANQERLVLVEAGLGIWGQVYQLPLAWLEWERYPLA